MEADDRPADDTEGCAAGAGPADVVGAGDDDEVEAAERAFVAGLIARGEAARPDEHGELPAGATHELIEDDEGHQSVRRRRFSAF
jgi:hypothetical protein